MKRVLKRIHVHKKINRSNFLTPRYALKVQGSCMPLEIRNASLALQIASLFEMMSSRGTSSVLSIERAGRVK